MKASELVKKSQPELVEELNALQKEHFLLKMTKGARTLKRTHLLRAVKKNIARVKTVLTQQQVNAND